MIATMAASTGESVCPSARRAELPVATSTISPMPASTASTATMHSPTGSPPRRVG